MSDEIEDCKPRRGRAVNWKQDPVILERLTRVEELYRRGRYNTVIARELGVDEKTIRSDIKRLEELWLERAGDKIEGLRAQRVAELEQVKRMALRSFDFDIEMIEAVMLGKPIEAEGGITRYVQRDDKGGAQYKADKVAALQVYRQATMDQAKILGLVIEKRDLTSGGEALKAYIGIDLDAV